MPEKTARQELPGGQAFPRADRISLKSRANSLANFLACLLLGSAKLAVTIQARGFAVPALSSSENYRVLSLRTEASGERKPAHASETVGELAGRFAAMLEQLNGVDSGGNDAGDSTPARSATERPVALGAVSLLALQPDDPKVSAAAAAPAATESLHDVRWLAKLYNDVVLDGA